MNISMMIATPSIWMQKNFFTVAESARGHRIGSCPIGASIEDLQLFVRVAAVAHAVLQFASAILLAVPISVVAAVQAATRPDSAGIFGSMEPWYVRTASAAAVAFASLVVPIASSLLVMVKPNQLDSADSFAVKSPIFGYSALLSVSLPPLLELSGRVQGGILLSLRNKVSRFGVVGTMIQTVAEAITESVSGAPMTQEALQKADQTRQWRSFLPNAITESMKNNPQTFDAAFNVGSLTFANALATAVASASAMSEPVAGFVMDVSEG